MLNLHTDNNMPYTSELTPSKLLCKHIPMPSKSHFTGMDAPTDARKWDQAIEDVCAGKLILLNEVLKTTGDNFSDIYSGGISHMWSHNLGDVHLNGNMKIKDAVRSYYQTRPRNARAPIIHLGHRFKNPEGKGFGFKEFPSKNLCQYDEDVPGKMVVIGCMDSNWGYLSTNMINR